MNIQISRRRIQRLGGSSLIITLPKSWIRKYGLQPGDEVIVVDEGGHLKVLPSSAGVEDIYRTLTISKLTPKTDLPSIVSCAFSKGYDKVEVEVNKNSLEQLLENLERAEALDIVSSVELNYNKASISLVDTKTSPTLILKNIRMYMVSSLEAIASGEEPDHRGLEESLNLLEFSVRELHRIMSKKGVTACEEAPLDPYTLGSLNSLILVFYRALEEVSKEPVHVRRAVADYLIPIIVSGLGGLLNSSVKRVVEARELVAKARARMEEESGERPRLVIVTLFLDMLDQMLKQTLCNIVEKQDRDRKR
ncbi:MAG: AbrB/MazE/SpoVT family DNA-binding domain-containing protein [Desulfurococcales archaeon]|nr:AbrB/MazE/SpoVT family DNA-binding domain-containing protein [Desulfurococcales archaeon]